MTAMIGGAELAVSGTAGTKRAPHITVRAAAEFAGVTPGAPAGVSEPAAPLDLAVPLMIEPGTAGSVFKPSHDHPTGRTS